MNENKSTNPDMIQDKITVPSEKKDKAMKLMCSSKIEIVFNYFDAGKDDNGHFIPTPIERIVSIDGEEIYRDKQKPTIYAKDKSILRQFEDWVNEYHSEANQPQKRSDVSCNGRYCSCFFGKLWLKLFGNSLKFKT